MLGWHLSDLFVRYFAINVQAMCDSFRRFSFVSVKAGGACHDSTAFAQSWLGVLLREGKFPAGFYIMGDAAYASHLNLLVPWPGRALFCVRGSFNF